MASTQRRLWLLDRVHGACSAYNMPCAFAWNGPVQLAALQASVRALVARHDALRMRVIEDGADASVEVSDVQGFELELIDLSSAPDSLPQQLEVAASRPFRLTQDRLFRAVLYRSAAERHVLFLNIHHFVCDGASLDILLDELLLLYAAFARDSEPALPAQVSSFQSYVARERARQESEQSKVELRSAAAQLEGLQPLQLPTDRPRPALFSQRGASASLVLSPELGAAIHGLARELGVTPYLVLLSTYVLLLARYSGQRDLAVAIPIAGRGVDDATVVGFFAKTLIVRSDLGGAASFSELVARVKRSRLAAFATEQVPLEQLVEALDAARDGSRTPLFQALFSMEEVRERTDPVTGTPLLRLRLGNGGAKTDLTLMIERAGDRFSAELEYCADLFEPETMARLLRNFETLLERVTRDPHAPAMRAPMLHPDEQVALDGINATDRELPPVGGFYELIQAQARRCPERTAIVDRSGSMSYGQLDRSSDEWAARLRAQGVTRGARVGVALGRSRRVLAVNLGIMKAGAAYVPLDASFPRDRLAFMARDAQVRCIIAERALADALPRDVPILIAEELERTPVSAEVPRVANEPGDIAYIIYTSGSTGLPKGVEVRHGGVSNLLASMARLPGCGPDDRVMAVSTFSFDMCIAELYLPLAVGACTILAPRTAAADGALLARFIDDYGATLVQATPTTFQLLVEAGLPKQPFRALAGGEAFPLELARALSPCCPEVWNGYGPTETTVYATFHRIEDLDAPVLMGRPIDNTRVYVLDGELQRVPFGVAGELYIAGAGVSAGYRNAPELTSARFLRDPFSHDPDARMYRTGDLVRLRAEGLQYLGRVDHQVKLRGYRIELGEIEERLLAHEDVEQAAVLVRELGPSDQRLVAYVTARQGCAPSPALLRAQLGKQLPGYMVPRLIVTLPSMPMTNSGKIDRLLLPDPRELADAPEAPAGPAPESASERALLAIWREVLAVPELGVDDDFFALGGHSLLAVRLVREINRSLHTCLSLGVVFEAPTIRAQAARIDRGDHGGGVSIVLLNAGGPGKPLFCICGINLYQALAAELAGERPVYGLYLPIEGALLEDPSLTLDPTQMARQYLEAIRLVQAQGPYHLAGVSFGGALAYEIARQLRADGDEVGMLALLDTILPSALPLLRMRQRAKQAATWACSRFGPLANLVGDSITAPKAPAARSAADAQDDLDGTRSARSRRYQQALLSHEPAMMPYDGDALLVRALDQLKQLPVCRADYGWQKHVRGALEVHDLPGDHLGILSKPHVRELARWLADKMAGPADALRAAEAGARS